MYIYPSNLKAKASLLFWTLRDVLIALVLAMLGMFALSQTQSPVLLSVAAAYAFLSIRLEDTSILDFLGRAWRFVVSSQQLYRWRWQL